MTPCISPNPSQAARLYGSVASRQEAALAASLRSATVTSRSLDLSLGKFGLSYQSADITLAESPDRETSRARQIFADAVEATLLYDTLACVTDSPDTSACGDEPLRLRQGLAAYSRQAEFAPSSASSMLSVLV